MLRISSWNFYMYVHSMALGTCTRFQLEFFIRNAIPSIHKFQESISESLWTISETTITLQTQTIHWKWMFNLCAAETIIFHENKGNAAHFIGKGFQPPPLSQYRKWQNANVVLCFHRKIQHDKSQGAIKRDVIKIKFWKVIYLDLCCLRQCLSKFILKML